LLIHSCSSGLKVTTDIDNPQEAFNIAMKNYKNEDYLQAIQDFSYIKIKFSGSNVVDKSQYYLAMSYFNRKEYILAAYEFENMLKNYPVSDLIVQARYNYAMCYYNLSPKWSLDQIYTKIAINEFLNFISLYPKDKLARDAQAKIAELRNKLAYKLLQNGKLYLDMVNYKSAIIYFDYVLNDYFDTDYAEEALYWKIYSLIKRLKNTEAIHEIERFEKKFPKGKYYKDVQKLKKDVWYQ